MEIKILINNKNILTDTLPDDEFYLQCLLEDLKDIIKFCKRDKEWNNKMARS
mgnify:CR=1 FL=1